MAEHVEAEAVFGEDVRDEVAFVGQPVICELLRAEDEDGRISQLLVFDQGQRGERLPETHGLGEDAAVVSLQLIDDAGGSVPLEIEELFPHEAVLVAGEVFRENVLADVLQKLAEDIVEHQEVDALR